MMIWLKLFLTFFKIGLFTFGGGYAMLPLIEKEVMNNNWMSIEDLVNFVAVSESTPGPFAVNISTYVGSVVGGIGGSICATLGVVMPSFIIILLLAKCYQQFKDSKTVKGIMNGLHPAVVGLIATAVMSIAQSVFDFSSLQNLLSRETFVSVVLIGIAIYMIYRKYHPIWVICMSAVVGIVTGYFFQGSFG